MPLLTNLTITAYCACAICCGPKATGLAANGKKPIEGVTVAGPRQYALGTKVYVYGVGHRTINDRLSKKYDSRIDVYFNDHKQAKKFGIRTNSVVIYESNTKW